MTEEDEAFNEIERRSIAKKEAVKAQLDKLESQEPVAYLSNKRQRLNIELKPQTFVEIPTSTDWEMPLYMKPLQRTWVGLTDEEMLECNMDGDIMIDRETAKRNVEAKLKEKNT